MVDIDIDALETSRRLLPDDAAISMCQFIAEGMRGNGFPLKDGKQIGWHEYVQGVLADAIKADRDAR